MYSLLVSLNSSEIVHSIVAVIITTSVLITSVTKFGLKVYCNLKHPLFLLEHTALPLHL